MNSHRLNDILDRRNLSSADAALIAGVTRRQVNNWRNGYSPIPRSLAMLLEFFDAGVITLDMIEDYVRRDVQAAAQLATV